MSSKKIRKDIIKNKITQIFDSLEMAYDNLPEDFEEFSNLGIVKHGIYKQIESSIERIIDICNILNSDLGLGIPENEEQIISNLEKNKIFPKEMIGKIKEIKAFRNVLVHKYGDIDDEKAFHSIKEGQKDFDKIISEIEGFLEKS